ncbi:MAG: UDP-N-acetylmuramoyl-tripeptide--D-alanyl-D-alanine ligase [Actinomycetia bacterium]|nr:UDP-N-acetylmuramoyl-tripeptide--D-alanyl-D-alanine ligase [Actinomycetes bacterium]MCH9801650.1 UDP-N-acetylmuramoyl-tripeptide--D-alanyl-D-alanine ligase [Actinomycetes bacterium]
MKQLTLEQIAAAVGGSLDQADPQAIATGAAADSRLVAPGDLFVAIVGERVDGHDYAAAAFESGAAAVLAQRPVAGPAILVEDPVAALGALARYLLTLLPELDVVGVTGSSGKTSTKDLLAAVFASRGPVVAPAGSFNSEVGLPLTVLRCDDTTRTLVLEMGARGIGHIDYLCGIAHPKVGVVLNVGSAHVGEFGSRDAIATAKGELPANLSATGVAVLNADDPRVARMTTPGTTFTYGFAAAADVRIENLDLDERIRPIFDLVHGEDRARVRLRVAGEHQASNAAAAATAGLALGMSLAEVSSQLEQAEIVSRWRMEVNDSTAGITVINDAYNANPESMTAALKALAEFGRNRPGNTTWAVLGEMLELGDSTTDDHDRIGRLAVRLHVHRLIAVGEGARAIHLGAAHEGSWDGESVWLPDAAAAAEVLAAEARSGDVVLIKASRAVGLERVAEALLPEEVDS